jgi:hypothetical protein
MVGGALPDKNSVMTASRSLSEVVIVGDTLAFGKVLASLLNEGVGQPFHIRHATYENFGRMLGPRILRDTGLFVLELWRTYPTGIRAEGLAVAKELAWWKVPCLVVSPLTLGAEVKASWYWDLGSSESLGERCGKLLRARGGFSLGGFDRLDKLLATYLEKPVGHESAV